MVCKVSSGLRLLEDHISNSFLCGLIHFRSPAPFTGGLKLRDLNANSPQKCEMTNPSKNNTAASKHSNASTGGHKFRALLSEQRKSPTIERGVSRTLFH